MSIRPVHRIKHVVDQQIGITAGSVTIINLMRTRDAPVLANTAEVETGSKCNAIYLHCEAYARTDAALANCYITVGKVPGSAFALPAPNVVGSSDLKRYIIHQEMVMLQRAINGNPRAVFNGVILIPKGYRRNGPDDALALTILAPGVDIDFCFQCHYKEFR